MSRYHQDQLTAWLVQGRYGTGIDLNGISMTDAANRWMTAELCLCLDSYFGPKSWSARVVREWAEFQPDSWQDEDVDFEITRPVLKRVKLLAVRQAECRVTMQVCDWVGRGRRTQWFAEADVIQFISVDNRTRSVSIRTFNRWAPGNPRMGR